MEIEVTGTLGQMLNYAAGPLFFSGVIGFIGLITWLAREVRRMSEHLESIDEKMAAVQELGDQQHQHEVEDARHFARIEQRLLGMEREIEFRWSNASATPPARPS